MADQWMLNGKPVNVDSTSAPNNQPSPDTGDQWMLNGKPVTPQFGPSQTAPKIYGNREFPDEAYYAIRKSFPYIGGAVGSFLAPEVAIPGALRWLVNAGIAGATAGVGGGTGEAFREAVTPEEKMSLSNIGSQAVTQALNEVGGRAVQGAVSKGLNLVGSRLTPEGMYQSALGPRAASREAAREGVVATGLREGVSVSRSGLDIVRSRIDAINNAITSKLKGKSDELGPVIMPGNVAKEANSIKEGGGWGMSHGPGYSQQVNPDADVSAINDVRNQFIRNHQIEAPYTKLEVNQDLYPGANMNTLPDEINARNVVNRVTGQPPETVQGAFTPGEQGVKKYAEPMTLEEAQAEKVGTYRAQRAKYQAQQNIRGALPSASDAGEMALARGIRKQIEGYFPEITGQNAREGDLINLEMEIQRFLGREGNKKLVGLIPSIVGAGIGGGIGYHERGAQGAGEGALIGATVLALNNPAIASRLAIMMDRARRVSNAIPAPMKSAAGKVINVPNAIRTAEAWNDNSK